MKTKIKNCVFWVLGVSFLLLAGCSEEIYENHLHSKNEKNNNSISFKRFLNETNLKDFKNTKSFNSTNIEGAQGRLVASEFYIDTTRIFRNTAPNNKVTYSLRAFPLSETVEPNSYYNIVYEKIGTQWNELIFLNKEKSNPTGAKVLESSEMVYNRISGRNGFSEVITITFNCQGCTGACDLCNLCVKTTVTYVYTGIADTGGGFNGNPGDPGNGNTGSGGGGGNDYGGIFIPNPYSNSDDPLDPNFIYDGQISSFINSLALQNPNIASLLSSNLWLYPYINQFIRDNSGLNNSNKAAVQFALETLKPITLINMSNLTFSQIYQLYLDSFLLLIHNPTPIAANFVNQFALNCNINQDINLNFDDSWRSPANIDRSSITNDTPEGQKFNEIYDKLQDVPEFKSLFIDLFGGTQTRFNVKFEIAEHVYNNNTEVDGTTKDDGSNTYLIKINKQCLTINGTRPRVNLERAKTIAHESIHAFLFNKIKNPNNGISIAGFDQMSLSELLNALRLLYLDQHNTIFNNLAPTLEKILKDLVFELTTAEQRANVESLPIYQNQNPQSNPMVWNWDTYFKYLSYRGLEDTAGFQAMFPAGSNALFIFNQYIAIGHANL